MMSKLKTLTLWTLRSMMVGFIACDTAPSLDELEPRAVVEAYLSAGDSVQVLVTEEIPFGSQTDTLADPIEGLSITLETENKTIFLADRGYGLYSSPEPILEEKTYTLKFIYNDKTISAQTTIPSKPQHFSLNVTELTITPFSFGGGFPGTRPTFPDPVRLTWSNDDQSYYLSAFKNIETTPESIFDGQLVFGGRNRPPSFNRPTQLSGTEIETPRIQYYGIHDIILMHVQPEYAALYETNGNNSLNLAAPPTNIENGLGIFTGYAADTLKLLVKKP
jgi:hypothetical protein